MKPQRSRAETIRNRVEMIRNLAEMISRQAETISRQAETARNPAPAMHSSREEISSQVARRLPQMTEMDPKPYRPEIRRMSSVQPAYVSLLSEWQEQLSMCAEKEADFTQISEK